MNENLRKVQEQTEVTGYNVARKCQQSGWNWSDNSG